MPVSYIFFITSSNYDLYRAEDNQIQFICENAFDHLNVLIRTHVNLERNICINESFTLHPYGWDHKRYNRMITAIQSNCTNFLWKFLFMPFMCFMCSSKIIFIALHYCIFWIKLTICLRFVHYFFKLSWNFFEDRIGSISVSNKTGGSIVGTCWKTFRLLNHLVEFANLNDDRHSWWWVLLRINNFDF